MISKHLPVTPIIRCDVGNRKFLETFILFSMLGSEMQVCAQVSVNATTLTGFKFFGIRVSLRDQCASSIGDNSTLIAGNGGGGGGFER